MANRKQQSKTESAVVIPMHSNSKLADENTGKGSEHQFPNLLVRSLQDGVSRKRIDFTIRTYGEFDTI